MEEIEKIMEEIRIRLNGYRVERTTVQDVPEPVMLIANPKTGYACGYLFSNIQKLLSQGLTPKEIAKRFCDGILETEQAHIYLESQMESFEKVKDKLFFRLASPITEREVLQHVVHTPFLDMEIVFYVELPDPEHNEYCTRPLISTTLASRWKKSATELFQVAVKNSMAKKPAALNTAMECREQALKAQPDIDKELGLSEEEIWMMSHDRTMYILTCEEGYGGAACIAYPGTLALIAATLKDDLYLLPSGVHEWMVMSGQYWTDGMENGAAQAFMSLGIPKEEFLTANAYHYKRATDSIEIVPLPVQISF